MKKSLASLLIVFAIIFATNFSCKAFAVVEQDQGYVSVNMSETEEIAPDQAQITIGIETSDYSLQKASDENKVIAERVYSSLKTLLNCEKGDYIKTSNYSASPVYSYTKDNKRVFDKYVVSNSVVIKTKNIAIVAKLIDTAIATGATKVNDLQFLVSDNDAVCSKLFVQLTKRAHTQASLIASSVNSKILGIKSIETSCNVENNQRPYYSMMAKSSAETSSVTPIENGKVKIRANISADFYVK